MKVKYTPLANLTQDLVHRFLNGEDLDPNLLTRVIDSIDPTDNTRYDDVVKSVKNIINGGQRDNIYNLFTLSTTCDMSAKEKATLVRFVNISHKAVGYFILLNGELIHYPEFYQTQSHVSIEEYVTNNLNHLRLQNREKKIRTFVRKWFFRSNPTTLKNSLSLYKPV